MMVIVMVVMTTNSNVRTQLHARFYTRKCTYILLPQNNFIRELPYNSHIIDKEMNNLFRKTLIGYFLFTQTSRMLCIEDE